MYSTVTVAGSREALQIAALPGTPVIASGEGNRKAPYLAFYCQRGSAKELNAFVDWRRDIGVGEGLVKLNGVAMPGIVGIPLVEGDRGKMSLPQTLVPLLREAIQIEVIVKGVEARFFFCTGMQCSRDCCEAAGRISGERR